MTLDYYYIYLDNIYENKGLLGIIKIIIQNNKLENICSNRVFNNSFQVGNKLNNIILEKCFQIARKHYLKKKIYYFFKKSRKNHVLVNDKDLLLNHIDKTTNCITLCIDNQKFKFTPNDIKNIFLQSLEKSNELIIKPTHPINPYTNRIFNQYHIHLLFTFLTNNIKKLPRIILAYRLENYNLPKFIKRNRNDLNYKSCINYINDLDIITIHIELSNIFNKYIKRYNFYEVFKNRKHQKYLINTFENDVRSLLSLECYLVNFNIDWYDNTQIFKIQSLTTNLYNLFCTINPKIPEINQYENGVFVFKARGDEINRKKKIKEAKIKKFFEKEYLPNIFNFIDPLTINSKGLELYQEFYHLFREKYLEGNDTQDISMNQSYASWYINIQYTNHIYTNTYEQYRIFNIPESKLFTIIK